MFSNTFIYLSPLRGSAIAKIIGSNAATNTQFDNTVNMWVFEEMINDRKLTEIINTDHENVKYLPGHKLPSNVVSNTLTVMLIFCRVSVCCEYGLLNISSLLFCIHLIYST